MQCQQLVTQPTGGKATAIRLSRVGSPFALGVVLCCLLGAEIAFDPNSPVPNPNNMPLTVEGFGTFKLEKGEKMRFITFYAQDVNTNQVTFNAAAPDFQTMTWKQKLTVNPSGKYRCWTTLFYFDNQMQPKEVDTEIKIVTIE